MDNSKEFYKYTLYLKYLLCFHRKIKRFVSRIEYCEYVGTSIKYFITIYGFSESNDEKIIRWKRGTMHLIRDVRVYIKVGFRV